MKKTPPEIKILPDDVANKIAAGEVVERPAAVVKELLENSIDAGAERIAVEFSRGGKAFVKVSDDGCGMTRQQALMSLEPHATSKIRGAEDLFRISSYGFRGEAVPSIASVSKFKMRTRPEAQLAGTEIDVYAGAVNSVRECGMAAGTEIVVENLFCSVPARRKFLKSDDVEASHIVRLCKLYALALSHISITLTENSREIFRSEKDMGGIERIGRVWGGEAASKLIGLPRTQRGGMAVEGAVLRAGDSFATSRNICAFINARPVDCRAIFSAVKEAYGQLVPKGRYAAAFLFITLPPESVDVNVHPSKREVRLKNEFEVRDFVCSAILSALENNASPSAAKTLEDFPPRPAFSPRSAETFSVAEPRAVFGSSERSYASQAAVVPQPAKNSSARQNLSARFAPDGAPPSQSFDSLIADWRYIGCLKRRYAIFETAKGMVMMSVSAALKRVRYEKILKNLRGENAASQSILIPLTINLERADDEFLCANKETLAACGFDIENFGKSFYKITSAPAWIPYGEVENFVRDFVETAREEGASAKKSKLSDEAFASASVRRLGSAYFVCSEISARELLAELLRCANHMSSPDGKPSLREISEAELLRMFSA